MRRHWARYAMMLGLMAIGGSAKALEIGTDASYTVEPFFPQTFADQDGPYTASSGSLNSHLEFGGSYYDGEVYFYSNGIADATASEGGNLTGTVQLLQDNSESMDFHASSSWSDTFTNGSGGALNYDFDFSFSGGTLALGGYGGNAMFTLDILLDGNSLWSRTATLTGDPHNIADLLANGGLDPDGLSHSIFQDQANDYLEVTFDPFTGNLDLGTFGNGDSFQLTYNLSVWASAPVHDFGMAEATAGDPFGVGFQGTLNSSTPTTPVPEPASLALISLGLAGLGARHYRQRR